MDPHLARLVIAKRHAPSSRGSSAVAEPAALF